MGAPAGCVLGMDKEVKQYNDLDTTRTIRRSATSSLTYDAVDPFCLLYSIDVFFILENALTVTVNGILLNFTNTRCTKSNQCSDLSIRHYFVNIPPDLIPLSRTTISSERLTRAFLHTVPSRPYCSCTACLGQIRHQRQWAWSGVCVTVMSLCRSILRPALYAHTELS